MRFITSAMQIGLLPAMLNWRVSAAQPGEIFIYPPCMTLNKEDGFLSRKRVLRFQAHPAKAIIVYSQEGPCEWCGGYHGEPHDQDEPSKLIAIIATPEEWELFSRLANERGARSGLVEGLTVAAIAHTLPGRPTRAAKKLRRSIRRRMVAGYMGMGVAVLVYSVGVRLGLIKSVTDEPKATGNGDATTGTRRSTGDSAERVVH